MKIESTNKLMMSKWKAKNIKNVLAKLCFCGNDNFFSYFHHDHNDNDDYIALMGKLP